MYTYIAHTETGTVGQRMTGAVMQETETLYSAQGNEGRVGDGGSEREGGSLSLPLSPPCLSLALRHHLAPAHPTARHPPTPLEAHTRLEWGRGGEVGPHAHSRLLECVFVYLDSWDGRTEQKRLTDRQTCMWGRHGWSILAHLCFIFSLTLTFLLFFYYCYFLIFEYFGS